MTVVTFVSYDGEKHEAPIEEGCSLMQVATNNAIPGIDGDCGGEAACGTCHVIVDSAWAAKVGPELVALFEDTVANSGGDAAKPAN